MNQGTQNQKSKLVELGFIYCLVNPITSEIFYIGATESAPKDRLKRHYAQFKEYLCGKRSVTKKYEYFESIFPNIAEIRLLEIVQNDFLYQKEIDYIAKYIKDGYTLTNQTFGGEGGDTFTLNDTIDKEYFSKLIANKHTGAKKPEGFAESLSKKRMGINNPMAGKDTLTGWVVCFKDNIPIKLFKFPFEITEFLDVEFPNEGHKKNAGTTGNICKGIRNNSNHTSTSRGFIWKSFNNCDKEIQDIVSSLTKVSE